MTDKPADPPDKPTDRSVEPAPVEASPEKIGNADTAAVEGVPVAVAPSSGEAMVSPVELARTEQIDTRAAEPPTHAATEPPPRAATEPPPRAATQPPTRAATEPPTRRSQPIAIPQAPILPTPAEAAFNAAVIVSEMVDIDSESGAVIAAAAAAGAAIEAAVAAKKLQAADAAHRAEQAAVRAEEDAAEQAALRGDPPAVVEPGSIPMMPVLTELVAATTDPVTTVKLSRDRILQALAGETANAADTAAHGPRHARARTEPGANRDSAPSLQRARSEPGGRDPAANAGAEAHTDEPEEFDPVAIAAAAIARLRTRAKTDLGHLRLQYQRHDGLVVLLALLIIIVAGRVHASLVTPPTQKFDERGLTFDHSTAWLAPEPTMIPPPRLLREANGGAAVPKPDPGLYHVELTSTLDPGARIEVRIEKAPSWSNVVMWLELDRRTRWGELYALDSSQLRTIDVDIPVVEIVGEVARARLAAGSADTTETFVPLRSHEWLRSEYRYAHAEKGDVPRIDRAIEYATTDRQQIYVITLFGAPGELERMEQVIAPSLRVQSQTGKPLVQQTTRLEQINYPGQVGRAFDSTVMVVVADLVDGRLRARGGGSGVIVGSDGSVLTNYHVIQDKDDRLHDVFVIARYSAIDRAPQIQCAGRPNRSKLQPAVDLALIKCDMDLDGRAWVPSSSGIWATLLEARSSDVKIGQRLWVLGYPEGGGGGLTLDEGVVQGWTGPDGASGRDYIKTGASISSGSSGGPVVNDRGELVGIASAFRANGKIGLVRPLQTASQILAYAAAGWTPLEKHNDVELTPTAVEASTEGIRIFTTVVDDATEAPIRDALVMVLRPGINTSGIDLNRLDDQAIAWGKTNAQGEVRLKQLVPIGTYTVMVEAAGYETLIGDSELHLDNKTSPSFDPWGKIGLRSR